MFVTRFPLLLVALLIALLAGCAQRETDVGSGAIPVSPDAAQGQTTILATHSGEWDLDLSTGQGTYLQVGEAEAFSAVSVLRFATEGLLPDSFSIDTARIRFRVDRIYPGRGSSPDLVMLIRRITEPWDEDSLVEGVLAGRDTLFDVIDTLLIPTQTDAEEIVYWDVPETILTDWLGDDSLNYGILLQAVYPGVLVGFQSGEGADSFLVHLELIGTEYIADSGYAGFDWADTLFTTDDGYLATDYSNPAPGRMRISQGSYRRALLYFPLDSITVNPLRTPVRAWIHLYADLDQDSSLVYTGSNFLYKDASLVDTDWFVYDEPDSARQSFVAVSSSSFGSDNVGISFEITSVLANLVGNPETNGGFSIQGTLESSVLSRQFFHAHDSEVDSLRPTLEVWWVEQ